VATFTAYEFVLGRHGNRSPVDAPQGLYRCRGEDEWIAISVPSTDQWRTLTKLMGEDELGEDQLLLSAQGRRSAHDFLDARISEWCAPQAARPLAAELCGVGIPAGEFVDPCRIHDHPLFSASGFIEYVDDPELGPQPIPSIPFRYASVASWFRTRAPSLGEANEYVICDLLGRNPTEFAALVADGVTQSVPDGY
jgi:crotonobetainyl-CoA:carnitine CoA-transferase CaiB-like acyl-CoA transferase